MKIEEGQINGKHVFFIRTNWGKLIFETFAEAKKFLDWFHARESEEIWAESQDEKVNNNNWLTDIALTLAYISFSLMTLDAVHRIQMAGAKFMFDQISKIYLQPPENKKNMNRMTKGDVGLILGDEWANKNIGTSMIAKLKTVLEPAPQEWIELAQKKLTEKKEKKKSPSSAPSSGM